MPDSDLSLLQLQVGSELDLYDVQTTYPNQSVDTYIPFLGELRDGLHFSPSDSSREMMDKVADMVRYRYPNKLSISLTGHYRKRYLHTSKCHPMARNSAPGYLLSLW